MLMVLSVVVCGVDVLLLSERVLGRLLLVELLSLFWSTVSSPHCV